MAAYVSLTEQRKLLVALPAPREQRGIAGVLGALDDKIESNRRLIVSVLHLCRLLLTSECSEFVAVGEVADLEKGLSYKGSGLTSAEGGGVPMVNLANFSVDGWLRPSGLKFYEGESKQRHVAKPRDLLVANTDLTQQRAILGRPALVPPGSEMLFTHHVFAVRFRTRADLCLPLWAALLTPDFRERAEGFATGTTVAGLPKEALLDFSFGVPPSPVIAESSGLMDRAWAAERESATLAELRDVLLPELLSGRLRVPVAEELVEAAT
jgi:type I restriction enzyme S subunit